MPAWSELAPDEVLAALEQLRVSGAQAVSGFLDTHQYAALAGTADLRLEGGYPAAQFRRAGLGTEPLVAFWRMPSLEAPDNVRNARQLRGWLGRAVPDGAVDSVPDRRVGIADNIGDIVWGEYVALVTAGELDLPRYLPFARRTDCFDPPAPAVERVTAASARIDSMVATLFRVSRAEAQTAVEYGFVFLNYRPVAKRTEQVHAGDQLVFRTKGRVEVVAITTNQRSGRLAIELQRYQA